MDQGCEGTLPQGKGLTIYKTDELIVSEMSLSLKTRGSEESTFKLYFL